MDTVRFGRQVRALRRRRGWRQVDLSLAADTSRGSVSRIERGHADETTLAALDAVARALSARLEVGLSWNGEGLDRLLDADHAAIVELVARELRALEWDVAVADRMLAGRAPAENWGHGAGGRGGRERGSARPEGRPGAYLRGTREA